MTTPQDELRRSVDAGAVALERRLRDLVSPLQVAVRGTRPPGGGWSLDMILEHLCLANGAYLAEMEGAVTTHGAPLRNGAWSPTLGGRLLVHFMRSERRLPAPKSMVPGPVPSEQVLDAMLDSLAVLRALLARADRLEWRKTRLVSPFARWLPLNLGDAALIILTHSQRHANQVARLRESLGA